MFPYHDENATQRTPYVTLFLIALNVLVWLLVQGAGTAVPLARSVCDLGLIPGELTASVPPGTRFAMGDGLVCLTDPGRQVHNVLTSMFLHGSWMHLLGNMWFLWLFGNNNLFEIWSLVVWNFPQFGDHPLAFILHPSLLGVLRAPSCLQWSCARSVAGSCAVGASTA